PGGRQSPAPACGPACRRDLASVAAPECLRLPELADELVQRQHDVAGHRYGRPWARRVQIEQAQGQQPAVELLGPLLAEFSGAVGDGGLKLTLAQDRGGWGGGVTHVQLLD